MVSNTKPQKRISNFKFVLSSHPVPDERSVKAANIIVDLLSTTTKKDLVLFLISGGGSSILALPDRDVSLEDKKITTRLLLKSGVVEEPLKP